MQFTPSAGHINRRISGNISTCADQKPARREAHEEGAKLLEPANPNPVTPRKEDQELRNRYALKPPREEHAKREGGAGGGKLRKHRMMQRGVLASCWDVEGGTAGVREMPILHGDTPGLHASAAAWPSGNRKEFETEEGEGGETGVRPLAAHSSEVRTCDFRSFAGIHVMRGVDRGDGEPRVCTNHSALDPVSSWLSARNRQWPKHFVGPSQKLQFDMRRVTIRRHLYEIYPPFPEFRTRYFAKFCW